MIYTWRVRYEDTSGVLTLNEGEEFYGGEYKLTEFTACSLNEALIKWYNDVSSKLSTNPYKIWSIQSVWVAEDKERYGESYWSGDSEDEQYKIFSREMDAIFTIMNTIKANEEQIYSLLRTLGYTKDSFIGTRYYKWAVSCEKNFGTWQNI